MKNYFRLFSLLVLLAVSTQAQEASAPVLESRTPTESQDLKNDFGKAMRLEKKLPKAKDELDRMISSNYNRAEKVSKELASKPDPKSLELLVGWVAFTLRHDPSWAQAELLLPLAKAQPKALETAIKHLKASDATRIRKAIAGAQEEQEKGNG